MATALAPFQNAEFQIVVTEHQSDGFRVEAPGLARALGMRDAYRLLESIPDEEKGYTTACTPGGEQIVGYVTEAGFYRALGQRQAARIPDEHMRAQVERFQSWVYREVLPALRRGESLSSAVVSTTVDAAMLRQIAVAMEAKDERIAELEPKAEMAETFLIADGTTRLVGQVAKLLGMRESALREFLLAERFIFRRHSQCGAAYYDHYAEHAHHFVANEVPVQHTFGTCSHYTLRITARGVELIQKRLKQRRAELVPL